MHKHEPKHFFFEIWIERQRVAQEIVNAGDSFHTSKASTGDHELSRGGRSARAHSVSASSKCAINRLRSWIASPSDFIVSARSETPGKPKKFVTDPSARTR